jgi:hypothetical protein
MAPDCFFVFGYGDEMKLFHFNGKNNIELPVCKGWFVKEIS